MKKLLLFLALLLALPASAGWTHVNSEGTSEKVNDAVITLNPTTNPAAGSIVIVICSADNIGSGPAETTFHLVTDDQGSVWMRLIEYDGNAVGEGHVAISIWASKLDATITGNITCTLDSSRTAKVLIMSEYTVAAGNSFFIAGVTAVAGTGTAPSITLSGLVSAEYNFLGVLGIEGKSSETHTEDGDYTQRNRTGTNAGSPATNITANSANRILTATSDTYNPTIGTSRDFVILLVALQEVDEERKIVEYFIDEAASGQGPTEVLDGSNIGVDFDLAITYDGTDLNYVEISGNRGLENIDIATDARASKDISDTHDKIRDNLHDAQRWTLEAVVRADSFESGGGRSCGINQGTGDGELILRGATSSYQFAVHYSLKAGPAVMRTWTDGVGSRVVLHIVGDSTEATANGRIKVYIGGTQITPTINDNPALDDVIDLAISPSSTMFMFNRGTASFMRAMDGVNFHCALYASAFSAAKVTARSTTLSADDDTPAVGDDDLMVIQ